ncbi:MAG: response regulator receiver [Anaerolineaceae bacterium]|nr:MAG: response regulator receiver [Anaerolineaceae bacterium]
MSNGRILLVEDNEDNFELVQFLLERAGYEVLAAHTGRECLEIARRDLPDLVLMDLSLPEMDGWTAAHELKADPKTAAIPLVAITAHTLPGDRKRALDSGFDEYLSKPINIQAFPQTIADAIQKKTMSEED